MKKVGFVGLGNMGLPMSENLVDSGYNVCGFDLNKEAESTFKANGGQTGFSLAELAQGCDVVITSLPSSKAVEVVYLSEEGLIKNSHPNLILIDTSTVAPNLNKNIGDEALLRGIDFLAAPVSGGVIGAINRTLTFMIGGKQEVFTKVSSLLYDLGENVFHVGEGIDSGTKAKLINNLLIGFYTAGVSEALKLAKENDLELGPLFDVLNVSYGQSRIYERNYKSFIERNDYKPGFTVNLLKKDLGFALEMAQDKGLHLPISEALLKVYSEACSDGYGNQDMAVLYERVGKQAISFQAKGERVK